MDCCPSLPCGIFVIVLYYLSVTSNGPKHKLAVQKNKEVLLEKDVAISIGLWYRQYY